MSKQSKRGAAKALIFYAGLLSGAAIMAAAADRFLFAAGLLVVVAGFISIAEALDK
jgi:hypothetical protein